MKLTKNKLNKVIKNKTFLVSPIVPFLLVLVMNRGRFMRVSVYFVTHHFYSLYLKMN